MATKHFKRLNSSEDSVKRCYPDASFGLYHESACRSLFGSEVEGGRRWGFFLLFFFPGRVLQTSSFACFNISKTCRLGQAKFISVSSFSDSAPV